MEQVVGIGGVFFRADDPRALARWYRDNLGLPMDPADGQEDGEADVAPWIQGAGPTVWGPFTRDTEYFGNADQQFMVNFRVRDLDAILAQLRTNGAAVDDSIAEYDYGRFAWASDPEGNRFELWEPADDG